MKIKALMIAATLGLSGLAYAGGDHGHSHDPKPLHGGIVSEVKEVEYELVANPDAIRLYLRDHGKAVDVSKAQAKLTLLSGSEKQEVELKPADGALGASGSFKLAAGTKALASVALPGKAAVNVRFALK